VSDPVAGMNTYGLLRYKCHKEVFAGKIVNINGTGDTSNLPVILNILTAEVDGMVGSIPVSTDYVTRHNPQVGGYFVLYADGYQSFSPADAFESGYSRL